MSSHTERSEVSTNSKRALNSMDFSFAKLTQNDNFHFLYIIIYVKISQIQKIQKQNSQIHENLKKSIYRFFATLKMTISSKIPFKIQINSKSTQKFILKFHTKFKTNSQIYTKFQKIIKFCKFWQNFCKVNERLRKLVL